MSIQEMLRLLIPGHKGFQVHQLGSCRGNPWVFFSLPLPLPSVAATWLTTSQLTKPWLLPDMA